MTADPGEGEVTGENVKVGGSRGRKERESSCEVRKRRRKMSKRGEMSGGTVDCAFIPSSPYVELHTSQPL